MRLLYAVRLSGSVPTHDDKNVPLSEVLSARRSPQSDQQFTVHYIDRGHGDRRWSKSAITFTGPADHCRICTQRINDAVSKVAKRPKRLLVVINPNSGKQTGRSVYEQQVAPIFSLCGIATDVIITEREFHARDLLQTYDLQEVDGVVCCSGDGLFNEVITGLFLQTQRRAGLGVDNPQEKWVPADKPIALVPVGGSNTACGSLYGIRDPATTALHVVAGNVVDIKTLTVHGKDGFITLGGLLFTYGFFADCMYRAQRTRWIGVMRYPMYFLQSLWEMRKFEADLEYTLERNSDNLADESSSPISEWTKTRDCFNNFLTVCVACSEDEETRDSDYTPNQVYLRIYYPRSRWEMLKHLLSVMRLRSGLYDYDTIIKSVPVTGFRVKVLPQDHTQRWTTFDLNFSCDGEAIPISSPEFEVQCQLGVIKAFCTPFRRM